MQFVVKISGISVSVLRLDTHKATEQRCHVCPATNLGRKRDQIKVKS